MNDSAKFLAGLIASAAAGFVLAIVLLPRSVPAQTSTSVAIAQTLDAALCRGASEDVPPFYSELEAAQARMHAAMDVKRSGIDRDFAKMMIPHHQGAIDMALVFLKYGQDERLRRLAQSIVVEQGQEIAYMRTLLDPPKQTDQQSYHPALRDRS